METVTRHNTAKDPAGWVRLAQRQADKNGRPWRLELVSIDGTTPSGQKRFTYTRTTIDRADEDRPFTELDPLWKVMRG